MAPKYVCVGCSEERSHVLVWQVGANIIAMYPSKTVFVAVGQLAIVILVLFSYPLQVHPCRNCLDKVFHPGHVVVPAKDTVDEDEGDEDEYEDHGGDEHAKEMSGLKHFLLTTGIVLGGFVIAYSMDDLRLGKGAV